MGKYKKIKAPKGTPAMPPNFLLRLMFALKVNLPEPEAPFVKPDNWSELSPEERRNLRLDNWVNGTGIKFASPEAEIAYKERATLLRDAIDMNKKPARVPVHTVVGVYPLRRVGLTPKALFYDQQKEAALAHIKYHMDLQPDANMLGYTFSGKALDLLDYQVFAWPGQELPAEQSYQFKEQEFMKADEYGKFLSDPSHFIASTVMPRMYKSLEGLKKFPQFALGFEGTAEGYINLVFPDVKKAISLLTKAAELNMEAMLPMMTMIQGSEAQGFPSFFGTGAVAPFDALGDVMRGTRGMLTDIYRRPDEVLAACDRYVDMMLNMSLHASLSSSPLVMMPLIKGGDRFMSTEQYNQFYWPSLKKLMLGLIEEGLIPVPFAEGSYNTRLETIADFPKNSVVWAFDQTDMKRASEVLKDTCAIMGNVPASLTTTGTPDQMTAYCKDLIETCGPSGNFILSNGAQVDEAKDENLKAMIDSVKQFSA